MNWKYKRGTVVALVAALALGLAACGGGDDDTATVMPPPPPPPTAYEMALTNIAAADTAEAAQMAYDAVKDDVTAAQGDKLQMAVNDRRAALEKMDRAAEQKMALMTAARMIDTSDLSDQELVNAARTAIAALRGALAGAADVNDADKSMYEMALNDAVAAVDMAQKGITTETNRDNQMMALMGASDALRDALAALSGATPTQELLNDANDARADLNTAISGGVDLTDAEKAPYALAASNAAAPISMAQMAFDDAKAEDEKTKNAAMAATAAKLFAGLEHPPSNDTDVAIRRHAEYGGTDGDDIVVTIGDSTDGTTATLMLDEDETVAALNGWTGQEFTASPEDGGTYEAVVYSNVGEPTEGAKFNVRYTLNAADATTNPGELPITGDVASATGNIASSRFDQSSGRKDFKLPANTVRVEIPGMYHGVSGTYYCEIDKGGSCTATKAADGFTLGGVTADDGTPSTLAWTFKPTDPEARLMDMADDAYASYGWWLHTAANGDLTASAFHDRRGDPAPSANITGDAATGILQGTATYTGGAAGKYALSNALGGPNMAGHFTADVELNAKFGAAAEIKGMVDNFVTGHDNDWEVSLNAANLTPTGGIAAGAGDDATTKPATTTWEIGGTGDGTGSWSGQLYSGTATKAPDEGTGIFTAEHGRNARMVGAFGVTEKK